MIDKNIYNTLLLSHELEKSIANASEDSIRASEHMAIEIIKKNIPSIDMMAQENIDLIARPLALIMLANEMILDNLFSETSLEGIVKSDRLPNIIKSKMLKVFAESNGISVSGESPSDLYSQIVFHLNNRGSNLSELLTRILSGDDDINSLTIIDSSFEEMERNKLSYIQLESSKAMHFTRTSINNGTLLDGGYSRKDRLIYDESVKSDRIVIPGAVDVVFSTEIQEEEITVHKQDSVYTLPSGYYIDIIPKSVNQFAIIIDDKMENGITKFRPSIFIADGLESEVFKVKKYVDPDFEGKVDNKEIEVLDVLYKGKYPLMMDLTIYSSKPQNKLEIATLLELYLIGNSRDISLLSPSEMMDELKRNSIDVTIASSNHADLYFSVGKKMGQTVTFPLSEKDIRIPDEITSSTITRKTISAHIRNINIEVE